MLGDSIAYTDVTFNPQVSVTAGVSYLLNDRRILCSCIYQAPVHGLSSRRSVSLLALDKGYKLTMQVDLAPKRPRKRSFNRCIF